jgi:hypothetical protein
MSTPENVGMDAGMDAGQGAGALGGQPSEEELRAAYEAELSRISSADMILQSAASLLNIGGLRLGLVPDSKVERDLEQVRDAIDAVRALLPIIERHGPEQLRPLRDALSQLQMAYTREVQAEAAPPAAEEGAVAGQVPAQEAPPAAAPEAAAPGTASEQPEGPGPAESSGRLWVPGR